MKLSLSFACALLCAAIGGCSATDKIDNSIDCRGICNRYKDCFDQSYGTSACIDRCENNSDDAKNFMDKVDACESCIDDKSCASATFNCATECIGIVP